MLTPLKEMLARSQSGKHAGETFDGEEEVFSRRWWHLCLESSWQKVWAGGVWAEGIPAGGSTAGTECGGCVRAIWSRGGREECFIQGLDPCQALNPKGSGIHPKGLEKH